jgi:predicted Zn-dependent protease
MKKKRLKNSDSDYKTRFEQAVRYRDQGCLDEASRLLEELAEQNPEDPVVALLLAGIFFDVQRFGDARALFAKIVHLKPKSELASRGLFHSLWKLERHDEAFDEMRRFLAIADSEDYRQLLNDMKADLRE